MSTTRRGLMKGGAAGALSIALAGSLDTVFQTSAGAEADTTGYGPLIPDPKGLLDLPEGFTYKAYSAVGEAIAPGVVVPGAHDGMSTFKNRDNEDTWLLVRNHEQGSSGTKPVAPAELVYDPAAYGGTTTLEVDKEGNLVGHRISIAGTATNCAGGKTPWHTWLTCEETEGFGAATKSHGWVFEVDPRGRETKPEPIKPLGRFAHEAVAIDPETHVAYLTEDASGPFGLLYRFTPNVRRGVYHAYQAGGTLEAMYVPGLPDLSVVQETGATFRAEWVKVPDPEAASVSTRKQFENDKITRSQKFEGAWWGRGACYIVCSYARKSSGAAGDHAGQVWRYDPRTQMLKLETIFKTGGRFDSPDNITVSPYGGGVILAEDGDGEIYLVGTTRKGEPFAFARNAFNDSEFAGVTFSPDGRVLFANRQSPGITFAITGPWERIEQ